jgi:20S proteasome alpha/beta subunit
MLSRAPLDPYTLRKLQPLVLKFKRRRMWPLMTVCAGFLCTDGLIIGADTEHSGGSKYHASKLSRATFHGGEYALTGTGSVGFCGMARDFIWGALDDSELQFKRAKTRERRAKVFIEAVDRTIKGIHAAYIEHPTYPDQPLPHLELILGVHFQGENEETRLMHCASDGSVYWVNNHVVAGMGQDIALRFLTILSPEPCPIDIMKAIALLCIAEAKLGAEGVGGQSELIQFPHPEPPIIKTWYSEAPFLEIAEEALHLAICAPREKLNDETFESRLKEFCDKLRRAKAAADRAPESERITLELIRMAQKERASNIH